MSSCYLAEDIFDISHIIFVVEDELGYFADGDEVDSVVSDFVDDEFVGEAVFDRGFIYFVYELGDDVFEFAG